METITNEKEIEENIKTDLKDKAKSVECPFCQKKGTPDDFLFNINTYYFACPSCGILFMLPSVIVSLKELVRIRNERKVNE